MHDEEVFGQLRLYQFELDALSRVPGVSQVHSVGASQYAMRIWVKPDQLAKLNITVPEIINAVNSQNGC